MVAGGGRLRSDDRKAQHDLPSDRGAARECPDTDSLPEMHPSRVVLNRLWPIIGLHGRRRRDRLRLPAGSRRSRPGSAIIWALAWRRQSAAVTRDRGARRRPLLHRAHLAAAADQARPDPRLPLEPDRDERRPATAGPVAGGARMTASCAMARFAYIPSPAEQRLLDRAAVLPRLRDLLRVRGCGRDLITRRRWAKVGGDPDARLWRRQVGLPGWADRRAHLLPDHHPEPDPGPLVGSVRDLGRWARDLGRDRRAASPVGSGTAQARCRGRTSTAS